MHAPPSGGSRGDDARDQSLLRRAQRGEPAALAELMRHHLVRSWRVCLALTLDRDEAEALLIEVTRTFWSEAIARGPQDALTAITRLARAKAAMRQRRALGEQSDPLVTLRPDGRHWGEASPYDAQYEQRLLAVFASWASEDRLIMALRAFERLPLADVAKTLALGATEPADRMVELRLRLEAAMRGEEPASMSGEHLSPLLLSASIDGTFAGALRGDGHELISRHLSACEQCRDLSARLRRHEDGLRRLLAFDPGEHYLQDLSHYLDQVIDAVAKGRHLPLRRVAAEVVETPRLEMPEAQAVETPPRETLAPEAAEAIHAPSHAEVVADHAPSSTPPPVAEAKPPQSGVHDTLDALMAVLGKGFETPRAVTRAPVEPPRTASEVLKPPSREMPRPGSREMPRPMTTAPPANAPSSPAAPAPPVVAANAPAPPVNAVLAPAAPAPPGPPVAATSPTTPPPAATPRRRASDFDDTIISAHRQSSAAMRRPVLETPSAPDAPPAGEAPRATPPQPGAPNRTDPASAPDRRRAPRALVLALAGALIVVVALYALPPVIQVSVPSMPSPRLPRIELVRGAETRASARTTSPAPQTERAENPSPAAPVTQAPARPAAPAPERAASPPRAAERRIAATPQPAAPVRERREPARVAPPPPARPSPEPAPAPAASTPAAGTSPPAAAATPSLDTDADWPLLCGEVRDEAGEPVAGARVLLADLDLGARTDRRGRFCIAAPPGDRTLTVTAQGFGSLRQLVSLGRQNAEIALTLRTGP